MIRGYPAWPSVQAGGTLVLHVSTDAPRFRVAFHRWWHGFEHVHTSGWMDGLAAPEGRPEADWGWPAYEFAIARTWPPGVYVAHLQEPEPQPLAAAMDRAAALFVVRGPGRSRLVYKLPIATYQAYNWTGGGCFYDRPPRSADPARPGARLSLQRPGGGIGGITFGAPDHYDPGSPRQTFAHWDAPFIRWLAAEGHEVEFCTDLDVHREPDLLPRHRLMVSVGHDEYWSEAMRDQVEDFVAAGGRAAFFAANLCWWRIHLADGDRAMVCHQGGPRGAFDHWWPATGAGRPEDGLAGVSYRHGGGWWDGPREAHGYIVQQPGHWVFEGTGLTLGARFGEASTPPLAGYECDGAPLEWADAGCTRVRLAPRAAGRGPRNAVHRCNWKCWPPPRSAPADRSCLIASGTPPGKGCTPPPCACIARARDGCSPWARPTGPRCSPMAATPSCPSPRATSSAGSRTPHDARQRPASRP